jgi:hypothetical protein
LGALYGFFDRSWRFNRMAEKKGKHKHGAGHAAAPVIADPRFSKLHTDPRFQRIPRAQQKVTIDPRFEAMFKDPAFQTKFVVDKRGKKKKGQDADNLQKYYRLEKEERKKGKEKKSLKESGGEEALELADENAGAQIAVDEKEKISSSPVEGEQPGTKRKKAGAKKVVKASQSLSLQSKNKEVALQKVPHKEVDKEDEDSDSEEESDSEAEAGERDVLREGFGSDVSSSSSDEEESDLEDEAEDKVRA